MNTRGETSFRNFHPLLSVRGTPYIAPELQFIPIITPLAYLVPLHILHMSIQKEHIESFLMARIREVPGGVYSGGVLIPEGEVAPSVCLTRGLIPINGIYEPASRSGVILSVIPSPGPGTSSEIFCCSPAIEPVMRNYSLHTIRPVGSIGDTQGGTPIDTPVFNVGLESSCPGTSPRFPLTLMEGIHIPIREIHQRRLPYLLKIGQTMGLPCLFPRLAEDGEEYRCQNSNDGYDDEQLD